MNSTVLLRTRVVLLALGVCSVATAYKPVVMPATAATCSADPQWLSAIRTLQDSNPDSPNDDCPFYRAAWQHFLFVTQASSAGIPAFLSYKTSQDLFGTTTEALVEQRASDRLDLTPRVAPEPHDTGREEQDAVGSLDVFQAGFRGILVDQQGRPVFYSIHVNNNFNDFLVANNLTTKAALLAMPENLAFPRGIIELKAAWQIVGDDPVPDNYITTKARVPLLTIRNHHIVVDTAHTRTVTVALLGLHVVFTLDGHPEFIWSTFEHVDSTHTPDLTPAAKVNPADTHQNHVVSNRNYPLYKAGTTAADANSVNVTDQSTDHRFDEASQTFKTSVGGVFQTSIYRLFPGSKSTVIDIDDAIVALNDSMTVLFATSGAGSRRANYRLVGAVWLKRPRETFTINAKFADQDGRSTDDEKSMLQGQDSLSNMAIESFTQDRFPNCFACHNTKKVTDDDTGITIVGPKLLNVSHVLSKFLATQGTASRGDRD
jgi:hypothetical protein